MALSSDLILAHFSTPERRARFWAKVDRKGGDRTQCWPWLAARAGNGYGNVRVGKHNSQAHRVAYVLERGALRDDHHILHGCDNPVCCNPWCGEGDTQSANMKDMVAKGRHSGFTRKLTPSQEELIALQNGSGFPTSALARIYKVNQRTIRRAIARVAA